MIESFRDEYDFLSNFYPVEITYAGLTFPSVENAYQAAKCVNEQDMHQFKDISAEKAKRLGRCIEMKESFDREKYSIMRELLHEKFQNPLLKSMLLNTAPSSIVEGNYWHDNYWGDCKCPKCTMTKGRNLLGELLQRERNIVSENPDIFTTYMGMIYHREEKVEVKRPCIVYDSHTMTMLRVQSYDICKECYDKLVSVMPHPGDYVLAEIKGINVYEDCEIMNNCIAITGYVERLVRDNKLSIISF